jgi:DNA-binding NarL/FixJ family response regulator
MFSATAIRGLSYFLGDFMKFTSMQARITQLLSEGLTEEEIAAQRCRSKATIRKHVEQARERVGARSKAHLVATAIRHGLIH